MATNAAEKRPRRVKRGPEEQGHGPASASQASAPKRRRRSTSSDEASSSAVPSSAMAAEEKVEEEVAESISRGGKGRSKGKKAAPSKRSKKAASSLSKGEDKYGNEEDKEEEYGVEEYGEEGAEDYEAGEECMKLSKRKAVAARKLSQEDGEEPHFMGDPVPKDEAKQMWPLRYQKNGRSLASISSKSNGDADGADLKAKRHYLHAKVDDCVYNLHDDVYVKAAEGEDDYIGRIVEFFEGIDNQFYFTAQWFFRAEDTAIKALLKNQEGNLLHDSKRVFLSEEKNDNLLDCIVSKLKIVRVAPNIVLSKKAANIPPCDLYYDMSYSLAYSTFSNLAPENLRASSETSSTISSESNNSKEKNQSDSDISSTRQRNELSLLDLYSGCGAMSTGLCLGANLSGINLETRWAVDINRYACESLKKNHPRTQVRNEKAEHFLALIKEWENLCKKFDLIGNENSHEKGSGLISSDEDELADSSRVPNGEFEVGKLLDICFGDPNEFGKDGLMFKVRWKGYGPSDDTWEPAEGLSNCQERIEDFVRTGYRRNILPLPGKVDVICGGPPCQGISGFNRFRNYEDPLKDTKNQQMVVFMNIVDFLKPKYVLMENVVDILKFANGYLGRYALSRLVAMNYQARLGLMVAGCYGLPQFRMRVFLWGACPTEILPRFPLPTHEVVMRGGAPTEFEQNIVAYDENLPRHLEKALVLGDAISDLPQVNNDENRDEMSYGMPPKTEFQRFIRLSKAELMDSVSTGEKTTSQYTLFDHRPLKLNDDDYQRVCQIPKRKGANFRNLRGVMVGPDNVVIFDPTIERVFLPSGKPLVPDYAMSFIKGKSPKPFGRLWWDETVPTVVTRAEPHNQAILHPEQDRVLSIRENARLQGFPDYYRLYGPIKERYIQVGNAVAVPVARALGYALGLASQRNHGDGPIFTLPPRFSRPDRRCLVITTDIDEVSE